MNLREIWGDLFNDSPRQLPVNRPTAPSSSCATMRSDRPESPFQTYQPSGEFYAKQFRFCFEYEAQADGVVRTYILAMPKYGHRDDGLHETHRFYDKRRGEHYICYDPMPRNQTDAMNISAKWADNTLRYIHYGTRF